MPMRGELPTVTTRAQQRQAARQAPARPAKRSLLYLLFADPELHSIACFCIIGLLITLNIVLRLPEPSGNLPAFVIMP